jgi:ABC-2 type transport system ATP-binding protein
MLGNCLRFNAEIYHIPKANVEQLIIKTGLASEAHKKLNSFQRGFDSVSGLANAFSYNPEVLILDEPTTGLDQIN